MQMKRLLVETEVNDTCSVCFTCINIDHLFSNTYIMINAGTVMVDCKVPIRLLLLKPQFLMSRMMQLPEH